MEDYSWIELNQRLDVCRQNPLGYPKKFPFTVEEHRYGNLEISVIRDDLLCGGTKSRTLYPYLIDNGLVERYFDYVYVSPWYGGAQIALAWTCALLQQKYQQHYQATLFYAAPEGLEGVVLNAMTPGYFRGPHDVKISLDDSRIPPYTKIALSYGAQIFFVAPGREQQAAQDYVQEHQAYLLPSGFRSSYTIDLIADLAKNLIPYLGRFDECWCAVGSGTLIEGLQKSKIADKYYGVCAFQTCPDLGQAKGIIPKIPFDQTYPSSQWPPFPSALHYDAKIWPALISHHPRSAKRRVLYWNVM